MRRTLLALPLCSIVALGCERRVEEPLPEVRPLGPSAVQAPPAKPWGNRCVKETPALARRSRPPSPDARCPKDPETPPFLRSGKVTFGDAAGTVITVEIAENDHDRQRGLMYRKSMPDDRGMIFWFKERDNHAFWMHNTCIPLDMMFIDKDGFITGIEENVPTMNDNTYSVGCASTFVLEVNAGWSRKHGVAPGQKAKFDSL